MDNKLTKEYYQVEAQFTPEMNWERNLQRHNSLENATHAASIFENASDVVGTRIVHVREVLHETIIRLYYAQN